MNFHGIVLLIYTTIGFGCTYRFTNLTLKPTGGAQKIAVEAIFDTSRDVLPHDILWSEVQAAIIKSGKLILAPTNRADALLRLHLLTSTNEPTGTVEGIPFREDPSNIDTNMPPSTQEFSDLSRASRWAVREELNITVKAELISLKDGKILYSGIHKGAGNYLTARTTAQAQLKSHFLLLEEGRQATFGRISRDISRQIIGSLLQR